MLDWVQSWPLASIQLPIDLMAAAVFAVTGALVASRKQMDIVGFLWLGVVTGVGGGTVRDLLIGEPVFWVRDPAPVHAVHCGVARRLLHRPSHIFQVSSHPLARCARPGSCHYCRYREGARFRNGHTRSRRDGRDHSCGRRHHPRRPRPGAVNHPPARDLRHGLSCRSNHILRPDGCRRDYGTGRRNRWVHCFLGPRACHLIWVVAAHLSRKARKTVSSTSSFRECQTMIATPIAVP